MDKYIDEFCEAHFSDFEELGLANSTDAFFAKSCMRPRLFLPVAFGASLVLIAVSILVPVFSKAPATFVALSGDVGIGLLSGSLVSLWFNRRDKAIRYYEKIVGIITSRMRSISEARRAANEHIMNVSLEEGLQLLQYTAQNAYQFAGYLQDKIGNKMPLDLVEGIVPERSLESGHTEEEAWHKVQKARQTIRMLQGRLSAARTAIWLSALGAGVSNGKPRSDSARSVHIS